MFSDQRNLVAHLFYKPYISLYRGLEGIRDGSEAAPIGNLSPRVLNARTGDFRQGGCMIICFEILSQGRSCGGMGIA